MTDWLAYGAIVFLTTFVVNVGVTALWPNGDVDLSTSAVVAGATSFALGFIRWRTRD